MENPIITGPGLISSDEPHQQQQVIDKLCRDYRSNLIRRFQESNPVPATAPPSDLNQTYNSKKKPLPEVLGANALIAEHLLHHGYYVSQSVFSAEMEFPGSGCEKANSKDDKEFYRLKPADVKDIVDALEMPLKPRELTALMDKYNNKKTGQSLLTTLLANACWKKKVTATVSSRKDLIAFNKYLKILVSRIAKVSMILSELRRRRTELNKPQRRQQQHHYRSKPASTLSSPNRPHTNRHRSRRRWGNSQIQDLATKIDKLSSRLTGIRLPTGTEFVGTTSKSYRDWVRELKSSRHGQRMIRKIERIIVKSLNKEQAAMQKNFDEKLETQKMLLKLHYKQKFLEHFQALNLSNEATTAASSLRKLPLRDLNGVPAKMAKVNPKKKSSSSSDSTDHCDRESKENQNVHKLISKPAGKTVRKEKQQQLPEGKEMKTTTGGNEQKVVQERKLRLQNVEQLINDAKYRIKQIRIEHERLDQSFNTYLDRQSSQTANFQEDVSAVWASYNVDRALLEKRRHLQDDLAAGVSSVGGSQPEQQFLQAKLVVPEIRIEKCKSNLEVGNEDKDDEMRKKTTSVSHSQQGHESGGSGSVPSIVTKDNSSAEFSNPFINFDVKKFLESTTKGEGNINQVGLSNSAD